jgi:hypothetical protein
MFCSVKVSEIPRMLGCLRSPFLYAFSEATMYFSLWPEIIGTL